MSSVSKPQTCRSVIDELVRVCREGQGQIGPRRARAGVWNANATAEFLPDQHEFNLLLARLGVAEREVLARLLEHEVELGIFEALKVLEEFEVQPFVEGYEGSPYHDFIGRLSNWKWPQD
jgi:hypothetical protein